MYRPFVESMLRDSPTFRRQCVRIAGEPALTVHLVVSPPPRRSDLRRAVTRLTRNANGHLTAAIDIGPFEDTEELIAHEFEHIIEQLDGVDLAARAALAHTGVSALGTMLTVEQRDAHRSIVDHASVAVGADGRFIAFTTYSQLVPADADNWSDVYVLDRERHHVTLESGDSGDHKGDASYLGISGDGRFVVFERADGVILRDRTAGVTTMFGEGRQPSITDDGRIVMFAANHVGRAADADVNGSRTDIYVADVQGMQVRRVSVDMTGLDASVAASVHPSASRDGRFVAFASRMQLDGKRAQEPQVFVRDTALHATRLVGHGWDPSISGDGRFVAFAGLANRLPHIFLADLHTGATRIITNSVRRGPANGASGKPKMSSDGRFVVFQSEASDLVAAEDFNLLWDVFVFDRTTGTTSRVSGDAEGVWMEPSGGPSIDAHGSVLAFSSRHPTDVSDTRNDFDLYVATTVLSDRRPVVVLRVRRCT